MNTRLLLIVTLLLASACNSSIEPEDEADPANEGDGNADDDVDGGGMAPEPGETIEATVDASSQTDWTYFDLETGKTVDETATGWDLALQRFTIKVNGGVSGDGDVSVAVIKNDFADVTADSASNFTTDAVDGDDSDMTPEYVFSTGDTSWFDYDPSTHKLVPRAHVYVVKTVEGGLFKVEIADYYNEAGSSGYPRLRFAALAESGDKSQSARRQP